MFEEKFDNHIKAFNKAKDFIFTNFQGILINPKKIKLPKKPKISVVIPCYNCKNYILSTIRSIQNQNFSNFEIVLVNDFPSNESLLYYEQLKKEDERIRIINNKKNMGTLYSRSIGALSANGKYIFPIDSDDMLLDEKVFSTVINIADKNNLDITVFNSIRTDLRPNVSSANIRINYYEHHQSNLVLFQPNLGYLPISPSFHHIEKLHFNEELMHAKCIKTKIYKKALNKLGEKRYSKFMLTGEDTLANIIIFNTAKIAKFIPLYGYIYFKHPNSDSKVVFGLTRTIIKDLYLLDAIIDFSQDIPNNKKVIINYIISLINNQNLEKALNRTEYNRKLFISFFDRIFNCKYISEELKNGATSLDMELPEKVDENEVIAVFLKEFEDIYELYKAEKFESILNDWRHLADTIGKHVEITQTLGKTSYGYAVGINKDGSLIIEKTDGTLEKIISGRCRTIE